MSIVLLGSTSGSCTLQEQAVAGTSVLTLPVGTGTVVANNVNSAIVSGTVNAGGTNPFNNTLTFVDFTGIPSWAKRITVIFAGVSTNGTSNFLIQLGDSGGIETTGYLSGIGTRAAETTSTAGFIVGIPAAAGNNMTGIVPICLYTTNSWATSGVMSRQDGFLNAFGGSKTLSDTITQIRITTVGGTDTFDAGTINILYE